MAEITKVSTPLIPKENVGNRFKPVTDQAFDLTDPSKIHKSVDEGKIFDRQRPDGQVLRDSMGREAIVALLKDSGDLMNVVKRLAMLVQTGISTSEVMNDPQVKILLESLFVPQELLMESLEQQDKSQILFKGEAFDVLRDILARFSGNPKIQDAITNLLKVFEKNVTSDSSLRSILLNCENILDYMFSKDAAQFSTYLKGLAEMLLPQEPPAENAGQVPAEEAVAGQEQKADVPQNAQQAQQAQQTQQTQQNRPEQQTVQPAPLSRKEAAQVLKNNLLPLLGEIVVKYHQNEKIRDFVMSVVHNVVRVDQGTPEALREAVNRLVQELRQLANLPENFAKNLQRSVFENAETVRYARNDTMSKLIDIVSETLRSTESNPAMIRQAETLMISLLQGQSSVMDVLHFILPMQTPDGQVFAEMYVDPDSGDGRSGKEQTRKLFLAFEAEELGSFELAFLQTGPYVEFNMWCPAPLLRSLGGMKRQFSDIMQIHGYTMNKFAIEEYRRPQSIVEVFPNLLNRKVGVDVRI